MVLIALKSFVDVDRVLTAVSFSSLTKRIRLTRSGQYNPKECYHSIHGTINQ